MSRSDQQLARLRFYTPLTWDCTAVLVGLALFGTSGWILCMMATVFALACAKHNDIGEA